MAPVTGKLDSVAAAKSDTESAASGDINAPRRKMMSGLPRTSDMPDDSLALMKRDVRAGLTAEHKFLPAYLFYDAHGSELYEQITELPEYYPTRTERAILSSNADEVMALIGDGPGPLSVVELGAGTSAKSHVVLDALIKRQGRCVYVPTDVSRAALDYGAQQIALNLPEVRVQPFVGLHESAFEMIAGLGGRRLVLFIGSSVGNLEDPKAVQLLTGLRQSLGQDCWLLLGTDLKKSESVLVPAYDDQQGVTAAFNRNSLRHINRELDGEFEESTFRHVALWNENKSRIEMYLESTIDQDVLIKGLGLRVPFLAGERIHTESSIKYDIPRVDALLNRSGFRRRRTFTDSENWFGVHLAQTT